LRHLQILSLALAALLVVAGTVAAGWFWSTARLTAGEAALYAAYLAAYLLPYPPLFGALARLERAQSFGAIGRAEGLSVALEFSLPAAAMLLGLPYWLAFVLAALLARMVRSAWIIVAARGVMGEASPAGCGGPATLLREGTGVQAIAALSMVRDQMHLWLLAPWFGATWAGLYSFALTACALACQPFVQTGSRVALPALRAAGRDGQWPMVLEQIRRLAIRVLPALSLLPAWLAYADSHLWEGRWHEAVALMPWFCLRMVAGVATTSLGAWSLVSRTPWATARTHALWTGIEVAVAAAGLLLWGPRGLAIGSAVAGWAGVLLFMNAGLGRAQLAAGWRELLPALLAHPALWIALSLALWVQAQPAALPWATAALPLAWWANSLVGRKAWTRRAAAGRVPRGPKVPAAGQEPMQPPTLLSAPAGVKHRV
jgi:hypothetical protein